MSLTSKVRNFLTSRPSSEPDARWKIVNLTRQTILADRVQLADRAAARNKGLLGRDGLGSGEGLWITPCEAVHTFGMRFSIDLVYLDRNKTVRKSA